MTLLQADIPTLPSSVSFEGKTAIVTGANSGLGYEASLHLLQHRVSTLVVTARTAENGETTKTKLLDHPTVKALKQQPTVLVYLLDLSSFDSVKTFANTVTSELPRLDMVILNAAMSAVTWSVTDSNYETQFQVNYASNALLSILLLPLLRKSSLPASPSYLNIVGSQMNTFHSFKSAPIPVSTPIFTYLNDQNVFNGSSRYNDTKLLASMWTKLLAEHVESSDVLINCLCPGLVKTNIDKNSPNWKRVLVGFLRTIYARSSDNAAWQLLYAVSLADKTSHGEMLVENKVKP